jgi:cold shock CspA family protein
VTEGKPRSATVKFFDDHKGFGFVDVPGLGDAFVHKSALQGERYRTLVSGEPILVEVEEAERGLQVTAVLRPPQRRAGSVVSFEFARGFGTIRDNETGEELFVHYSNILTPGGKAELVDGEKVDFFRRERDHGGFEAIYVKRLDARAPWDRFAYVPTESYQQLAALAESEDWSLDDEDARGSQGRLPLLESYIRHTFARLVEQEAIAVGRQPDATKAAAFNTGLVTPNQEEIYGFFVAKDVPDSYDWRFVAWAKASDNRLAGVFQPRPPLARYWEDPEVLFYDTRRPLILDWDHFVEDNIHRYPEGFRETPTLARAATVAAVEVAKQRVQRNYKTAVPQFHRGEVQLLLPLSLDGSGQAHLALVVRRAGHEYVGETVLPLSMAIKNARLLSRPDRDWLQP